MTQYDPWPQAAHMIGDEVEHKQRPVESIASLLHEELLIPQGHHDGQFVLHQYFQSKLDLCDLFQYSHYELYKHSLLDTSCRYHHEKIGPVW